MNIDWSSLKDTIDKDNLKHKFNSFISGSSNDIEYLSNTKPVLTSEEYKVLENMNKKQNKFNRQVYNTTILSLSFNDFLLQWAESMIFLFKDLIDMIYTKNMSLETIFLLVNTENRMFFTGVTLIMISVFIFVGDL